MKKYLKYFSVLAFSVLILALAACEDDSDSEVSRETSENKSEKQTKTSPNLSTQNFSISPRAAVKKFQKKNSKTEITSFKFEYDEGRYIYEIEGQKGKKEYNMEIDAKSKEILRDSQEQDDSEDDTRYNKTIDFQKIISPKRAMANALKEKKGRVLSYEIDTSYGKPIYQVTIQTNSSEYEITLNGTSGKVIQVERD